MSQHILVTGGAGYIGSHTCKALAAQGFIPVVYDNLVHGHESFVKWGPFVAGELSDAGRLAELIETYKPCAAIHFAAFTDVGESVRDPIKYYNNNLFGTFSFLQTLLDGGIKRIVFSSTAAVYGVPNQIPIPESHTAEPINPYGMSKRMIEKMLADFHHAYGLKSICLRYFNASGADPDGEIGEDHTPETHLIPLILDVAMNRRSHINIFGSDYPTPDGTCVRDYIHVTDLAAAHVLAIDYLLSGGDSSIFNLGNGQGFSVKEVIETVKAVTGLPIKTELVDRRAGDPPVLVADARRAMDTLGWRPAYSDINAIVSHAWAWHQKRFGG